MGLTRGGDPAQAASTWPSLPTALLNRAHAEPDRPLYAVRTPGGTARITVSGMAEEAARGAAALAALGVGPGDTVALWAYNCPMWLSVFMATAWRGAVVAALHPAAGPVGLADAVRMVRPSVLIHPRRNRGRDSAEVLAEAFDHPRHRRRPTDIRLIEVPEAFTALSHLDGYGGPPGSPFPDGSSPLTTLFTSGSTGTAKAAVLSHRALLGNAALTADRIGIGPSDALASPLPLYHAAGVGSGALLALLTGARMWTTHRFDPAEVIDAVIAERCTVLLGVPTTLLDVAGQARALGAETPSLRMAFIGGAHCDAAVCRAATAALGLRELCLVYGQTECGPTVTCEVTPAADGQAPDSGRPLPSVRLSIRDTAGREQPPGVEGQLWVSSPTLMAGYLTVTGGLEDPTVDGWMPTGDLGYLDRTGRLVISGRVREMIVRGGENVAPREVEAVLRRHPGVADACVVGVPSLRLGEQVAAAVAIRDAAAADVGFPGGTGASASVERAASMPGPGARVGTRWIDEISAYCSRELAPYQRPVRLAIVDRLPRLSNGKVDRAAVRSLLAGPDPDPSAPGSGSLSA